MSKTATSPMRTSDLSAGSGTAETPRPAQRNERKYPLDLYAVTETHPDPVGGAPGWFPIVDTGRLDDIDRSQVGLSRPGVGRSGESMDVAADRISEAKPSELTWSRWLRRGLMLVSLGLLARMAWAHFPEIRDGAGHLLSTSWWLVVGAVALEAVWTFSLANVYRSSLIGFGGRLSRPEAVRVSMGAFSLSRILPGGGAAGSVFAAREMIRAGNAVPSTVVSMLVSWWVSMLTLALVVGLGTAAGVAAGVVGPAHLAGPALVAAALIVVAGLARLAVRRDRFRNKVTGVVARAGARLRVSASAEEWEAAATAPLPIARLAPLVGWAVSSWLTDAAALWLMFAGFGVQVHPAVLLVGYGLANLINALPELTPGWLGVMETALAAAYAGLGVPAGVAVVAVLCYRLVSYWLPVAAGLAPGLQMLRARPNAPAGTRRQLEAVA